jgi:hypothetical protein
LQFVGIPLVSTWSLTGLHCYYVGISLVLHGLSLVSNWYLTGLSGLHWLLTCLVGSTHITLVSPPSLTGLTLISLTGIPLISHWYPSDLSLVSTWSLTGRTYIPNRYPTGLSVVSHWSLRGLSQISHWSLTCHRAAWCVALRGRLLSAH